MKSIIISGTGAYVPENRVPNSDFANANFHNTDGTRIANDNAVIIRKFKEITGIEERRYADNSMQTSDMATIAARKAIEDAQVDPETIDGIILAHNFGNIPHGQVQTDILPSLASRVKHDLGIRNPDCFAFDILYGCPGWIQGVIIARQYILAGEGKRFLVIGAEALSRVVDPFDRDSMIFADGAAASIVEESDVPDCGILSVASRSYTEKEAYYLRYSESNNKEHTPGLRYIKMDGRKIYEFALTNVPAAMAHCLKKSNIDIDDVKKVFIHQANEKMDEAIIHRFYDLFGKEAHENVMPMSIHEYGNSSVATVPTLFDAVIHGKKEGHVLNPNDVVLMASVGAGMNVNAITYRMPPAE